MEWKPKGKTPGKKTLQSVTSYLRLEEIKALLLEWLSNYETVDADFCIDLYLWARPTNTNGSKPQHSCEPSDADRQRVFNYLQFEKMKVAIVSHLCAQDKKFECSLLYWAIWGWGEAVHPDSTLFYLQQRAHEAHAGKHERNVAGAKV